MTMTKKRLTLRRFDGDISPLRVFLLALGLATAMFLPFVLMDKGYLILSGDFNVQQISFYKLAHQAVRSGNFGWNWYTDLGVNFLGSYSFYLIGSPFFWLTIPFPNAILPYLMAPLLILKTSCAAFTSYLYLRRFVRDGRFAMIGALLYAFSGWMSFNIFFNHFHDVAVFFPLLLLAVEKLVTEDKIGWVAAMVAVNAVVNYWFFIGEVVFVLLYFIVRTYSKGWRITGKKFLHLVVEAVAGLLLAAFLLLPSLFTLLGNPRTGTDRLLSGWGLWIYPHGSARDSIYPQRVPAILGSFFFPPHTPSQPNLFPDHGAKWASLSGWLPLFGLTGVFAYFNQTRWKKDWVRKLLGISLFFALIPGLNSLFILLNDSYYARWFYMPILIMALATARSLEQSASDLASYKVALKWVGLITAGGILALGLTPNQVDGVWQLGLTADPALAWAWFAIVLVGLLLVGVLLFRFRYHPHFTLYLTGGLAVIIVIFNVIYLVDMQISPSRVERFIHTTIEGKEEISLPEEPFARADIYDDTDNQLMFWGLPNIQTFHSVVPVSILEFYPSVGVTRDVGSRPEPEFYALRSLLSVRWLFIQQDKEQDIMPGYQLYDQQMDYNVYENQNYLPMGFAYDSYIDEALWNSVPKEERGNLLLGGIYLTPEGISRHADLLEPMPVVRTHWLDEEQFALDVAARKQYVATDFRVDNQGFSAQTDFSEDKLVFFSVPWEGGWSAAVNGQSVPIEKANVGFMAVRVPAGTAHISFTYRTPGLRAGLFITLGGLLLWGGVLLLTRQKRRRWSKELAAEQAWFYTKDISLLSWDEYLGRYTLVQRRQRREPLTVREAGTIDYTDPALRELLSLSDEDIELIKTKQKEEIYGNPKGDA